MVDNLSYQWLPLIIDICVVSVVSPFLIDIGYVVFLSFCEQGFYLCFFFEEEIVIMWNA